MPAGKKYRNIQTYFEIGSSVPRSDLGSLWLVR